MNYNNNNHNNNSSFPSSSQQQHSNNDNNNNTINKSQSSSSSHYSRMPSSSLLFSVMPSSSCFVKPLATNMDILQKDAEFIFNANHIQYKLPLYRVFINGNPCTVLLDSGASANYLSPRLQSLVSNVTPISGQSVETANGQRSEIKSIASFSIALGRYTDRIQAYVFDSWSFLAISSATYS
jgi:hypothetical protein